MIKARKLAQFHWARPTRLVLLLHNHVHAEGLTKSVSAYADDEHCSWPAFYYSACTSRASDKLEGGGGASTQRKR